MRDRNEWFKEAKGALRHLEIEAVETPSRGRLSRASRMGRMSCMHLGFIRLVMSAA